MAVPLVQTTAYAFKDTDHAANLFALKELDSIYTGLTNPTTQVLEQRFTQLEGGVDAICVASGQSAIFCAIANVTEAGGTVLISDKLYGGATILLTHTIKRFGINAKIFSSSDASNLKEQIDQKTRLYFLSLCLIHRYLLLILRGLLLLPKNMEFLVYVIILLQQLSYVILLRGE